MKHLNILQMATKQVIKRFQLCNITFTFTFMKKDAYI